MILYRGEIKDNHLQKELIAQLKGDLDAHFGTGGSLSAETVIRACDKLAGDVLAGKHDDIVIPFLKETGISDKLFRDAVHIFTREGLEYKIKTELPDIEKDIGNKRIRERYPLGVLFHIAAGNFDVLPAYSVVEGLLAGNVNILKLPMGDSGLSVRLLKELTDIEPELKDYIYVFDVPSTETVTLKEMAALSDAVVVWGGDRAVEAARTMVGTDTKIIAWGHKLSFAYATPDAPDEDLIALAKHISLTNQLLCSSCQGIFLDTEDQTEVTAFAERFFRILSANLTSPTDFGMKARNAINLYNDELESHITNKKIFKGNGVSVIACEDEELELSYLYRNVWVKKLPLDRIHTLRKHKNHLQTASVLTADRNKAELIAKALARAGVVRILRPGDMSETINGEAHDGTYALREYSRIVEFDRNFVT